MDVKQAANVLDLIEFFAERKQAATLTEIAKHFSWPRSSTFNLLGTLASRGFLYEPHSRGSYYPSPKWMTLLKEIEQAEPVPEQLQALLHTLAEETGETVVLAALSGSRALFTAAVESQQAVRYTAQVGKMVPLHITATGRALLSQLGESSRAAILRKAKFEKITDSTLMDAAAVEKEIARSIKRGWFEGAAEYTADLGGVALPLAMPERPLAIMVAGPMYRIRPHYTRIARRVKQELAALGLA